LNACLSIIFQIFIEKNPIVVNVNFTPPQKSDKISAFFQMTIQAAAPREANNAFLCPGCHEMMTDLHCPLLLDCGDVVCKSCWDTNIQSDSLLCPICNRNVRNYSKFQLLSEFIDRRLDIAFGEEEDLGFQLKCPICSDTSVLYILNCGHISCNKCVEESVICVYCGQTIETKEEISISKRLYSPEQIVEDQDLEISPSHKRSWPSNVLFILFNTAPPTSLLLVVNNVSNQFSDIYFCFLYLIIVSATIRKIAPNRLTNNSKE
jgi:hypothetical protein